MQASGGWETDGGVSVAGSVFGAATKVALGVLGSVSKAMGASSIGWVSMLSNSLPLPPVEMLVGI